MGYEGANIFDLAGRQHAVVSATQLRAAGLSRNEIARRVRRGWLQPLHRGVYAVGHRPLSWRAHWMAATLASGQDAALSDLAAGALWRLGFAPSRPIQVTVPTAAGRRPRPGIVVHRTCHLPPTEVTRQHGIPVTTPARTILDLAAVLARRRIERALDETDRLRLCTLTDLHTMMEANRGRPGTVALAAILKAHDIGSTLTQNELEELFFVLGPRPRPPPTPGPTRGPRLSPRLPLARRQAHRRSRRSPEPRHPQGLPGRPHPRRPPHHPRLPRPALHRARRQTPPTPHRQPRSQHPSGHLVRLSPGR